MNRLPLGSVILVLACSVFFAAPVARAGSNHNWTIASPNHEQTFAYGSETNRVWVERGRDRHLAVVLSFTNDPYVDRDNPRQYDEFTFAFPAVTMGKNSSTFYYHAPGGLDVPVATKRADFLGISEIHLLPQASLTVEAPHGYLSLLLSFTD